MIERLFTHCMIRPADVAPSDDTCEVIGVLNPGVAAWGDEIVLLARVVERPIVTREGYSASPRYVDGQKIVVDWLDNEDLEFRDPRVFNQFSNGLQRLRFISYLKVFFSKDGRTIDRQGVAILPESIYEEYGIEDPRITIIDGVCHITYVAVSRHGVSTCLMTTSDFEHFERHGIIFCPENKDVLLFPEKIDGEYLAMHRPVTSIRFRPPEMWLARSPDLIHWGGHQQLLGAEGTWQNSRIGGGTPPLRTDAGWMTIYHGSQREVGDEGPGIYTAGVLLLDGARPHRILGRSQVPIIRPVEPFEKRGFVNNVIFPTAIVPRRDDLLIYYGAADESVGVMACERQALLDTVVLEGE